MCSTASASNTHRVWRALGAPACPPTTGATPCPRSPAIQFGRAGLQQLLQGLCVKRRARQLGCHAAGPRAGAPARATGPCAHTPPCVSMSSSCSSSRSPEAAAKSGSGARWCRWPWLAPAPGQPHPTTASRGAWRLGAHVQGPGPTRRRLLRVRTPTSRCAGALPAQGSRSRSRHCASCRPSPCSVSAPPVAASDGARSASLDGAGLCSAPCGATPSVHSVGTAEGVCMSKAASANRTNTTQEAAPRSPKRRRTVATPTRQRPPRPTRTKTARSWLAPTAPAAFEFGGHV